MNPLKKHQLDKSISPPPPLRRKLYRDQPGTGQTTTSTTATTTATRAPGPQAQIKSAYDPTNPNHFKILSWNVNGTSHLLPSTTSTSTTTITQNLITTYFATAPNSKSQTKSQYQIETSSESSGSESYTDDNTKLDTDPRNGLRALLKYHNYPQILCLQEVKINATDKKTQQELKKSANPSSVSDNGPTYTATFNLPRDRINGRGFGRKNWGVATFVRDDSLISSSPRTKQNEIDQEEEEEEEDNKSESSEKRGSTNKIIGQTHSLDWDLEGRILLTHLHLPHPENKTQTQNQNQNIAILNTYFPNGTKATYKSPQTGQIISTRHDFKRNFHKSLLGEILKYEKNSKGYEVIIIGDMNIAPQRIDGHPNLRLGADHIKNRQDFNSLFLDPKNEEGMRGIDVFRWFYGRETRRFSYHGEKEEEWGRSCDRVDLVIGSSGLLIREGEVSSDGCGEGRGGVGGGVEESDGEREEEEEGKRMRKGVHVIGCEIWESIKDRGGSDHVPIEVVLNLNIDRSTDRPSQKSKKR